MGTGSSAATSTAVKGCAILKFDLRCVARCGVRKQLVGVVAGMTAISAVWGGIAYADPAQDAVSNLTELSQQVEQLAGTLHAAQVDLDNKLQLLGQADRKHTDDLAALNAAQAELAGYQATADKLAAAVYMGGRTDGLHAILTAASPKSLIDQLAIQRSIAIEASAQMQGYRRAEQEAQAIQAASAQSLAEARAAADAAATIRADMQSKQSQLRSQVTTVRARVAMLPPAEQAVLKTLPDSVVAALGPIAPIPTVGMGGLVPNARMLAAYIMATYPGVRSIGGVRSDPLPDHPSGRAIDIMIGSDMSLGDAINSDLQAQAGRFGISYTMWRVASHFDHVHVTVS